MCTLDKMQKALKRDLFSQGFNSRSKLNTHTSVQCEELRDSRKKIIFQCRMCSYEAGKKDHLILHMMTHTGERPFKCTVQGCQMEFKSDQCLKKHIDSKHSDERPFKCMFSGCFYAAKRPCTLTVHMKVHSNDRPFACPIAECSFLAKLRGRVKRHLKSVHSEAKTFVCSICDYKTARKDSFKFHMSRHTLSRDFKCSHTQCQESFKTLSDLKSHFSNRHEERNTPCDHLGCRKKFGNALALWKHKWDVHSNKNFPCPISNCSYRASIAARLRIHMIVHEEGNEKISCLIKGCEYKGKNNRALNWHMRRHETLFKCPMRGCTQFAHTKTALKNHIKLHNPLGRRFKCPLCTKRYSTRVLLDVHTAAHTKEKPFRCGICEHASSCRGSVRTHISSVHPNIKFPYIIILPLNDRECVRCKLTLPLGEFSVHSMGHMVPVVVIERLEIQ